MDTLHADSAIDGSIITANGSDLSTIISSVTSVLRVA